MKTFLCRNKKPVCKWGMLPDGVYYRGNVPEGFSLAICPSPGYVVIDVDRHGNIDGFNNIPKELEEDLINTLHYPTKNNGTHYWFKYSGDKELANKTSNQGIDLRVGGKGYCVFYMNEDIRDVIHLIKESSTKINTWLESLFSYR